MGPELFVNNDSLIINLDTIFIQYTGQECPKCGRNRLCEYASGHIHCEKCWYDPVKQKYISQEAFELDNELKYL